MNLPEYVGPCAFGIKMGVVVPGCDFKGMLMEQVQKASSDNLLADGDVLCITESVVARWQNNYVSVLDIAEDIKSKFSLKDNHKVGVLFPILSRNRFAMIMEGIALAVPKGEVVVQLSYPCDEVGNQILPPEVAENLEGKYGSCIRAEDIGEVYTHPITGVNYIQLYKEVIKKAGAKPVIYLCNDPQKILEHNLQAVIVSDIHTREKTCKKIMQNNNEKYCTLQDIFSKNNGGPWSEFGLLGSNMSSGNKIKLAPYQPTAFVLDLQKDIYEAIGKKVEIIIYGDGAYKDPSTGIYELADPYPAFGATPGVCGVYREGVKYKYLADLYYENGKSKEEIIQLLEDEAKKERKNDSHTSGGTTPRRLEDILASLADLVSGSADAGTPLILIKGIN